MPKLNEGSSIFSPNVEVGIYATAVPASLFVNRKIRETFIVVPNGQTYHTVKVSNFAVSVTGPTMGADIKCVASDKFRIWLAVKNEIFCYASAKRRLLYKLCGHISEICKMELLGDQLLSLDVAGCMKLWNCKSKEVLSEMTFDANSFDITSWLHPHTYVNKMLFGSRSGKLQLWNIRKSELVYEFSPKPTQNHIAVGLLSPSNSSDEKSSVAVTAMAQSSVLDVVAIGYDDGTIRLLNLKADRDVMEPFCQDWGTVTSMVFRQDGVSQLISGGPSGELALWDLEKNRLANQKLDAHCCTAVSTLFALAGEPMLITCGADNAIRLWVLDGDVNGTPRLLRERAGHREPPSRVVWIETPDIPQGELMLTTGSDASLRQISLGDLKSNRSYGFATSLPPGSKKTLKRMARADRESVRLGPILDVAFEPAKHTEWSNIATVHANFPEVVLWSADKVTCSDLRLKPPETTDCPAGFPSCVALTVCGNFALVGYSSGQIHLFNVQSGIHRGIFGSKEQGAFRINGIIVDLVNSTVLSTSASPTTLDVKFWSFKSRKLMQPGTLPSVPSQLVGPVGHVTHHRDNGLVGMTTPSELLVVDLDMRRLARRLTIPQHESANATALTFSPNGSLLVCAMSDSSVLTYHLPGSVLVDHWLAPSIVTSLAYSPNSHSLALTLSSHKGVTLLTNKTVFKFTSFKALPRDHEPKPLVYLDDDQDTISMEEDNDSRGNQGEAVSIQPSSQDVDVLSDGMVRLSLVPESKWSHILDLEAIRQRNKAEEPVAVPDKGSVPFFLPTTKGLVPTLDVSSAGTDENTDKLESEAEAFKRHLQMADSKWLTQLLNARTLGQCKSHHSVIILLRSPVNFLIPFPVANVFDEIKSMNVTLYEAELRLMPLDPDFFKSNETEQNDEISVIQRETGLRFATNFSRMILHRLETSTDFELCHAYLALFLKIHGNSIRLLLSCEAAYESHSSPNDTLSSVLTALLSTTHKSWTRIRQLFDTCHVVTTHLKSTGINAF